MYFENDRFTERENDVINLLIEGKSNKQIALELIISNRTVEFHLGNIYTLNFGQEIGQKEAFKAG